MRRVAAALALALGLAACGLGDDAFHPASFPSLWDHGGERLHAVHLVTITYPNDPHRADATAFDEFVLGSSWLHTVGDEYDVHGGDHVATIDAGHAAPAAMTSDDLFNDLVGAINALGAVKHDGDDILFMIYLPQGTTLTAGLGTSCVDYGGYHAWFDEGTPYAVIADCDGSKDSRSVIASHEIIEAATDPHLDALYVDGQGGDPEDPWHWWENTEVGDMCEFVIGPVEEDGWKLQRSWSQAAAQASRPDPCVPVPAGDVWQDLDTDPRTVMHAAPGAHLEVGLRAWASAPGDPWTIDLVLNTESTFTPSLSISRSDYFDGDTGVLSIDVPADAQPGQRAHVHLWSGGQLAPVEVVVQ